MAEFTDALDVQAMAATLIKEIHKHLAEAKIRYLFREGPWERQKKETWGTAQRITGQVKYLTGYDFIITISREVWQSNITFRREMMEALLDHELQHCCKDEDQAGNNVWYIQGHDVEDFASIVRRHGLWSEELIRLMKVSEEYAQGQIDFAPEDDGEQSAEEEISIEDDLPATGEG